MKFTLANEITILRLILIGPFIICMLNTGNEVYGDHYRYAAFAIFLIMCISDYLDGYFARIRNEVSPLGTFLDPLADKLLMLTSCILLASEKTAVSGFRLPPTVIVLIIGKDLLLLMGFVIVYLNIYKVYIVPVHAGKSSTFVQLFMVAAILLAPEISQVLPFWIYLLRFLWWSVAGMAILATFVYIRAGICYIEEFEDVRALTNKAENYDRIQ
ncbi:MAG: CDP-alcohol phosphatidyltransferase family protein [Planctomycetes bacterium]|nr:CDP-alcohol phosphatidyltransferase family protein [Planctomycetota bacterium]